MRLGKTQWKSPQSRNPSSDKVKPKIARKHKIRAQVRRDSGSIPKPTKSDPRCASRSSSQQHCKARRDTEEPARREKGTRRNQKAWRAGLASGSQFFGILGGGVSPVLSRCRGWVCWRICLRLSLIDSNLMSIFDSKADCFSSIEVTCLPNVSNFASSMSSLWRSCEGSTG